jgi:hypothetical protein
MLIPSWTEARASISQDHQAVIGLVVGDPGEEEEALFPIGCPSASAAAGIQ